MSHRSISLVLMQYMLGNSIAHGYGIGMSGKVWSCWAGIYGKVWIMMFVSSGGGLDEPAEWSG